MFWYRNKSSLYLVRRNNNKHYCSCIKRKKIEKMGNVYEQIIIILYTNQMHHYIGSNDTDDVKSYSCVKL